MDVDSVSKLSNRCCHGVFHEQYVPDRCHARCPEAKQLHESSQTRQALCAGHLWLAVFCSVSLELSESICFLSIPRTAGVSLSYAFCHTLHSYVTYWKRMMHLFFVSSSSSIIIMVALCNRADHYIFMLWFVLLLSFFLFFPRLISAVGDWMSTILRHMVWS